MQILTVMELWCPPTISESCVQVCTFNFSIYVNIYRIVTRIDRIVTRSRERAGLYVQHSIYVHIYRFVSNPQPQPGCLYFLYAPLPLNLFKRAFPVGTSTSVCNAV